MVQSVDNNVNKPNYNAVRINIKKPELNVGDNTVTNDKGIFNAVDINIDNPTVNTEPKKIYDYPEAQELVTYDNIRQVPLPQGFHFAYQTTNVILPKIENELEVEVPEAEEAENTEEEQEAVLPDEVEEFLMTAETEYPQDLAPAAETTILPEDEAAKTVTEEKNIAETEAAAQKTETSALEEKKNNDEIKVPSPSFTSLEAEKSVQPKRPEIIPGEEIKPEVDIPLVISNLTNKDFDVQAQQMEEIARISLDNPQNAVPYIVKEVFASLIDITKKDTKDLPAPTNEQIEARKKIIANFIAMETANSPQTKLPYNITEKEIAIASEISPMEQAERNKEYALYTMAILAKVYTDEVERHTGNIVPMTDIPGVSATVDALRYNPNSGVKIAAIDALRHIQRPEYKEELTTLYTLAQADTNPQVSLSASRALQGIQQQ